MERKEAFEIVKAAFEKTARDMNLAPLPNFMQVDTGGSVEKKLVLKQKQINDQEFAVLLMALRADGFFTELDVSSNLITNAGAAELASLISSNALKVLQEVHLEDNLIKDPGGEELERSKTQAFHRLKRNWLLHTKGNPMSVELVLKLKTPILQLQHSRRASAADSLSIKDTSPIPTGKMNDRRSSAEFFDAEMRVSELNQEEELPKVDVGDDLPGTEAANYRGRDISQIPYQLSLCLNLKRLALGGNKIVTIGNLPETLEALELRKNLISTISGLDNLAELKFLDLSENKIANISGLDSNFALREIHLGSNNLKQVSGLEHLRALSRLNLASNNISNFVGIRTLSIHTHLRILVLHGNPIFLQAKYKSSVSNLLPHLVMLDFMPVHSWKTESFNKTQGRMPFFSVDFANMTSDTSLPKVTPRFANHTHLSISRKEPLSLQVLETSEDPYERTRPNTTTAKPRAPRLKGKRKPLTKTTDAQTSILHRTQKSTSAHTTYFLPEEAEGPHMLNNKEKEETQKHLKMLSLFRGVETEFLSALVGTMERRVAFKGDVLQDGDVIVHHSILVMRGSVTWKNTKHGPWSALFLEHLVVPMEAEDAVVAQEKTDFIFIEKQEVLRLMDVHPQSKDTFYRNYDNLQLAKEAPMLQELEVTKPDGLKSSLSVTQKRYTHSTSRVPKINLKQLVKSETSQSLGLTSASLDPRSLRVQSEISRLLTSDPFRPDTESGFHLPTESCEDWKEAVKSLEEQVSGLLSFYQRETQTEKDKIAIEEEAKEFMEHGEASQEFELLALKRPALQECVDQAFLVPLSESISEIRPDGWMEEYVSILERDEDESVRQTLDNWVLEMQRDMDLCILTISNVLLLGQDEKLFTSQLTSYKDLVDEYDLLQVRVNPKEYVERLCGDRISNPQISSRVDQLLLISSKANYCKDCLDRLLVAVEAQNKAQLEDIRGELIQEGVLNFSLLPSQFYLTEKKKGKPSSELKTRALIRKNEAISPDSSVTSGVSSRQLNPS